MKQNKFSLDENFDEIIKNALPNKKITEINLIPTGWTNIVFEVITNEDSFFFRFPRDDFWSRTIVKDYEFSKFIYGKTDFNTVKLNLLYNDGRPFSMHKKINGTVLADKMNTMSPNEISKVSKDISKFMYQLHQIPFNDTKIFSINNIGLDLASFLDELLSYHVDLHDKSFWNYEDFSKKEANCLVHGDFNSSNILLDDYNNVTAIIDFGFGGYGNKYSDIARIIGRCPDGFKNEIVKYYEEFSDIPLNISTLDTEIDIWNNIDNAYINYMRKIGIYNRISYYKFFKFFCILLSFTIEFILSLIYHYIDNF